MNSRQLAEHCPDWRQLVALRRAGAEPADWSRARCHLRDCPACRALALRLDPTLLFQLLPDPLPAADEVSAMQQRVAIARRDRATAARLAEGRNGTWLVAAAAVVLLLLTPTAEQRFSGPAPRSAVALPAAVQTAVEQLPLVEAVDAATTPFYEWSGPELSIVLLAGERRDV